jgi:XTP/dITP diphosphohydrolase
MQDKVLVLATRNHGKVRELTALLEPFALQIKTVDDFPGCPEVVEDGTTFEENARKKAEEIARFLHIPALADDSGLEVKGLAGQPGIRSARFAGPQATDHENNEKLLNLLQGATEEERCARFRCVLALALPQGVTYTFEGSLHGQIVLDERGQHGFGYDPIFFLPERNQTLAELSKEEKNQISHRAMAIAQMLLKGRQILSNL